MSKEELLKEWLKQKNAEGKAKKKRYDLEKEIEAFYQFEDAESKSFTEDNFKVKVKKNFAYTLDQEKWKTVRIAIDGEKRPEKIKFELDKPGFNYLKEHDYDTYKLVSDCVTIKQNKTTIDIEKI